MFALLGEKQKLSNRLQGYVDCRLRGICRFISKYLELIASSIDQFQVLEEDPLRAHLDKLTLDLSSLLTNADSSDVVLVAGDGEELPAHKLILSARSPIFAAMFSFDSKEKQDSRVEIPDVSSDTLKSMLKYIYSGQIDESENLDQLELFQVADKV